MKGWKPTTHEYNTLYDQLFEHYFDYPKETEEAIRSLTRPLQWFPPHWFSSTTNIPSLNSGRMGRVYIMSCKYPQQKKPKKMIIREINLCMVKQQEKVTIPNRVIGITAVKSKHKENHHKLAFVSVAVEHCLEQLIPQVEQWTFQKTCRIALSIASTIRDLHTRDKIHPNLQPRNILVSNIYDENTLKVELVDGQDDWPSIPISTRYGRYPYISPEICYDHSKTIIKESNIYALGIILWQLGSGVIFPNSVTVCPEVYQINQMKHLDPAYQDVILRCLSKHPEKRPTAETICDALIRILMSNMTFKKDSLLHTTEIRDRQMVIAKYLIRNQAKNDLDELMQGASLSKRMMVQVMVSLEWRSSSPTTTTTPPPPQKKCHYHSQQRKENDICEDEHGRYIPANRSSKKQKYIRQPYRVSSKKDVYCGADLPELMQMGFA